MPRQAWSGAHPDGLAGKGARTGKKTLVSSGPARAAVGRNAAHIHGLMGSSKIPRMHSQPPSAPVVTRFLAGDLLFLWNEKYMIPVT